MKEKLCRGRVKYSQWKCLLPVVPSLRVFHAHEKHFRRFFGQLRRVGDDPLGHFQRVAGLEPCLTVQQKTFFPNMCQKIFAETIILNGRKRFAKTIVFGDFRVFLSRHCTISFNEELQLFFSLKHESKNALDFCLETHFALDSSQSTESRKKRTRTLEFEMLWKRRNKIKVTSGLDLYQETVQNLPKLLSKNKQEVGRMFLYQGGVVVFYSDLSK